LKHYYNSYTNFKKSKARISGICSTNKNSIETKQANVIIQPEAAGIRAQLMERTPKDFDLIDSWRFV
jgi:hypothetical protein